MSAREDMPEIEITAEETDRFFCLCRQAPGNADNRSICDPVFSRPETFNQGRTVEMARHLAKINGPLVKVGRKYILIAPGPWCSVDRWLGIPVNLADIGGVGANVKTVHPPLHADPSQGSHFFHNITSLGINYPNVGSHAADRIDRQWPAGRWSGRPTTSSMSFIPRPITLKVDGWKRLGILLG